MENSDTQAVECYFNYWDSLIHDLSIIYKSKSLNYGKLEAELLSLTYIEALGKLLLFDDETSSLSPSSIFCKTLQKVNISKKDANKLYTFRSQLVHEGPYQKTIKLNQNKKSTEIDVDWLIETLKKILALVKIKDGGWTLKKIASSFQWVKKPPARKRWSEDEVKLLHENKNKLTASEIAKNLKRTEDAIRQKAYKESIKLKIF